MKLAFKKSTYLFSLFLASALTLSCDNSDSSNAGKFYENEISIPFMVHAGATHLQCGIEMTQLGTSNATGFVQDFRLFIHDVALIDKNGTVYPITLADNKWQTQNVALISFADKSDCPNVAGDNLDSNMEIVGSYDAPNDAVIEGLAFRVGVPFELNHADPTEAESPLNIPSMAWNWQAGYKHMRVEASINSQAFVFHLGSVGCDGDPLTGGTTECEHNNRPEIILKHFDIDLSAVEIDFQSLLENIDVNSGGSCHSSESQAAICQGIFDSLGLDFYDGDLNTLKQANEGQSVFHSAFKHD